MVPIPRGGALVSLRWAAQNLQTVAVFRWELVPSHPSGFSLPVTSSLTPDWHLSDLTCACPYSLLQNPVHAFHGR